MAKDETGGSGEAAGLKGEIWPGDAFELIDSVPDCSVDLILTSPPYWGLRSYGLIETQDVMVDWLKRWPSASDCPPYVEFKSEGGVLGLEPYPEWYVAHIVEFFDKARRVLKASGSVWLNLGDTYFARWSSIRDEGRQGMIGSRLRRRTPAGGYLQDKQMLLMPARVAINMQDRGWILRNDLIWAKPNVPPRPEVDRLRLAHEHWFHFVGRSPTGRASYYYNLDAAEDGALDVVICSVQKGAGGHSATFPEELVRRRLMTSCPEGGLVLDPFCGTGRAVAEAVKAGRRGIGFELSDKYASLACEMLSGVAIN